MMSEPRTTEAAADLQPGEWIRLSGVGDAQVHYAAQFGDLVFLVVVVAGADGPISWQLPAGDRVPMLTADEVAHIADMVRRESIARDLVRVADMIRDPGIPLPSEYEGAQVKVRLSSEDAVLQVAQALGLEVGRYEGETVVTWPQGRDFGEATVEATWHSWTPPDVSGHTFTHADVAPAVIPVPDHALGIRLTGRNGGDPRA